MYKYQSMKSNIKQKSEQLFTDEATTLFCRPNKYSPASKLHTHQKVQEGAQVLCGASLSVKSRAEEIREDPENSTLSLQLKYQADLENPSPSLLCFSPTSVSRWESGRKGVERGLGETPLPLLHSHISRVRDACLSSLLHTAGRRKNSHVFPRSRSSTSNLVG